MNASSPTPRIASRTDWLAERMALLAEEKALDRARDAVSAKRRALPLVEVDKPYRFDTETGPASLLDLFAGRRQLIVYHFMFGMDYAQGCPSCSFWADTFNGTLAHLAAQDTAFTLVSKAPLDRLLAYRTRMGWTLPWASAGNSGFNEDFCVSFTEGTPGGSYNYAPRTSKNAEYPGLSTFLRQGTQVLHGYSTYARGLDRLNGTYHLLDSTPLGRQEQGLPWPQAWIRRHDTYPT